MGVFMDYPKYPLLSQERVNLLTSNYERVHSTDSNKIQLKISRKVAVGILSDSQKIAQQT